MPELTGQQIYEAMYLRKRGTKSIDDAISAIGRIRGTLADVQDRLRDSETRMAGAWKGNAADAAVAAAKPMWASMDDTVANLNKHEHSLRDQGSQFNLNSNQLRRVTTAGPVGDDGQPLQKSWWDSIVPWDTDTDDKINAYNADANFNKAKFNEYKAATDNNTRDLPGAYENAPAVDSDVQVIGGGSTGGVHGPTHRAPTPGGPRGGGGPASSGGGRHGGTSGEPGGGAPRPGVERPPPNPGGGPRPGEPVPPPHNGAAQRTPQQTDTTSAPTGATTAAAATGEAGPHHSGAGVPMMALGAPALGLGGEAVGGKGNVAQAPGAYSGTGQEKLTAVASPALDKVEPRSTGTPGMLGGQGAKREKDSERTLPTYLISEDNGNAIVGDLPSTAPPVIE